MAPWQEVQEFYCLSAKALQGGAVSYLEWRNLRLAELQWKMIARETYRPDVEFGIPIAKAHVLLAM